MRKSSHSSGTAKNGASRAEGLREDLRAKIEPVINRLVIALEDAWKPQSNVCRQFSANKSRCQTP